MGMHVIHYGHEESDVICDEHVTVTDRALLERVYGIYDWKNQGLKYNQEDVYNLARSERKIKYKKPKVKTTKSNFQTEFKSYISKEFKL